MNFMLDFPLPLAIFIRILSMMGMKKNNGKYDHYPINKMTQKYDFTQASKHSFIATMTAIAISKTARRTGTATVQASIAIGVGQPRSQLGLRSQCGRIDTNY